MDWNNDGFKDLIIGHYGVKTGTPTGKVHYFERNSNGSLKTSEHLKYSGKEITARYTAPCVVDWNNDGLLDLIVGTSDDTTDGVQYFSPMLFINEGTKEQYLFNNIQHLKTSDNNFIDDYYYGRVHPKVADLNNDGKKDLILNGWEWNGAPGEQFLFYENIGTDNNPILATKKNLMKHDNTTLFTSTANYRNARFDIYDWNQDGFEDIIWVDYKHTIDDTVYVNPIYISLSSTDGPVSFSQKNNFEKNIKYSIHNNKITFPEKVKNIEFRIFSINGKSVLSGTLNGTANTIKLNNLSQGNYFLRLSDGRGLLISRSIQIIE